MNTPPRKIPERGLYRPVWAEFNRLVDYVREISPLGGRNIRQTRTMNGTLLLVDAKTKAQEAEPSDMVQQFRLKAVENNFYKCRTWNGSVEGGTDVFIARPFQQRLSNFNGRTVGYSSDGDIFSASFAYLSPTKRNKTIGTDIEVQVILPYFTPNFDIIYAADVSQPITVDDSPPPAVGAVFIPLVDPSGQPITLLDLNVDGRAWSKK